MTDDLTVVIPSTETDTAKYIDIPPAYISAVQVEEVEPDSQLGPVLPSEAAVLKIQFEAAASAEYYINEVSQRPCQIYLAFDKRDDALLIKREIGVINAPRHNAYRNPTGAVEAKSRTSFTGQSFKGFSQSAFLDVSRHPAQTLGVSTGNIEETRDLRLQQGTATNSQAYNFLAVSNIRGSGPVAGSDSRHPGGDQAFKTNFAGGILVGTDVIDVGQEALQDDVLIHGRSISEDTELMRPTSSSAWHGGLEAIENAKELGPIDQAPPSNIKAHMPNTGENLSIVDDADDDLYYATPPRQNHQPRREASNNSAQNPEACQPHPAASVALIKPKSKKLSQSMRVVGNEESLALPPTTDQGVRPNQKGRNQEVEMLSPHITKPAHLKRKSTTTGAAGPRKKPKVNIVSVEKTVSGRNNAGSIPSRGNEYDLPVTPPGSKRARQKPRASANSMPKVVKSKPRVATPAKTSKQAAAKSFIMRDSDTRKGLRGVKSVEQKQASTAAKTEWDPDPLMDTNKDKSTEGDKGATKPDQKQSRKTKTKATGGGQKAKRSQPTQISTASKAIRISQDAPNRSPRKPRAAKKIAKERISALKDEAIQAVEISSQQETSCRAAISIQESKITAHETPERSVDSANEVMKATQTLSSRKKRRRSSSEACTGNGAKRKPVGDQETNSEQSGPELEDLLLATEPATGESMNQESEPLAGSRSSIEYSTTSATRPSKQRRAPSNIDSLSAAIPLGEKAEGAQYILNNQEAPNFVVDDSKIKPEALKSGTNSLNPRTVDDQDVQSTTHDTDSDDPPFPIMLDIANERADEKATTTMHGGSAKHSTEGTKETTPSKRENSAAALSTKITIPSKENPLDEQVVVSDTIRGKLEESNSSYGLPKTSSQGKKNLPPQSRTTHTLQQSVSAIDGDELQCLHKRSPRNPLNERDYENKILSKRTNPAQVAPGSKNQALSSTLIPAASKLLHKPSPSFSPAHQPKIHPEHQGHDGIRKEETTNRAMTACMINKSDNERRHDIQQQHAEANTEAGIPEILEPQRSEYASIASLALEMDLNDEEPMGPSPPVQHINTPGSGAASVAVRIDPTINPPQHQLPLQASATPDNRSPAWSRLPDAVNEHWDKKRRLLSQAHQASRPNIPSTATHKDPNRRPQLINFSKQGPRNQGVSSPAVSFKSPFIAKDQDPQMEETTFIPAPARRRDIATMTDDALDKKPVHAPIELPDDMDDMEFVQEATLVSDSAPPGFRQARQRTKGPCLEHSIVFASDHAPKVSSQSSRVTENGSPMPVQRTLPRVSIVKEPCRTNIAQVGSKNINVLSHRDKTVSVHQHDDESSEIELPQLTAPRSHPRKQPAFLGSSNSKHHPSSPNAPSAIVTDVQPHTVEPNGRLVNLRTEKILVPSQPPNPFANQKIQHTNRFLDKLRRASDEARDKLTGGSQDLKASQQPRGDRPADDKEDPDRTLVEYPTGYSGRKKQATPTGTSTSSLDTSSEESGASEASDASNVMLERWRQSLEPHQENMWAILHEISHVNYTLVHHILHAANMETIGPFQSSNGFRNSH